jgi:hypothetical protein
MSKIFFGAGSLVPGGGGGGGTDPTFTTLSEGQIPKADATGKLVFGGATVDPSTLETTFDSSINVPAGSINVGEVLQLSEGIADLVLVDLLKGQMAFSVNAEFTDLTGTSAPTYFDFGAPFNSNINLDDSQVLTANPLSFSITGASTPPDVTLVDRATIRTNGPMTNVALRVTDNATGKVIRYVPSRAAWDGALPGLTLGGPLEITFYFAEEGTDDATNIYLGYVPFLVESGQQLDFDFKGDSVDLLGEIGGTPYLVLEVHDGPPVTLLDTNSATWATVLSAGNTSGGSDVVISDGDTITSSNTGQIMNLSYSGTTGVGVQFFAPNLTAGSIFTAASSSTDPGSRVLASVSNTNVAAANATVLQLLQNADQCVLDVVAPGITANNAVDIVADNLTTGSALSVRSNGTDATARNLVEIINDNVAAFGTVGLLVRNDALDSVAADFTGRVNVTTDTATDEGFLLQANSLTTGRALEVFSNSANTSTRSLVVIDNANAAATGATCLLLEQLSTGLALDAQGDVNIAGKLTVSGLIDPTGLVLDEQATDPATPTAGKGTIWVRNDTPNELIFTDDAGTEHVIVGVGAPDTLAEVLANGNTTGGTDIDLSNGDTFNSLTTGQWFSSNTGTLDASTTAYSYLANTVGNNAKFMHLVSGINVGSGVIMLDVDQADIAAAGATTTARFTNADTTSGIAIESIGRNSFVGTGVTSGTVLDVTGDLLTTGKLARFYSNSADTNIRSLVEIVNDNSAAVGAECLLLRQDANDPVMTIDQNGNDNGLDIVSSATTGTAALNVVADALTSGSVARFYSSSPDATARDLVSIVNDASGATGATCLYLDQDADQRAMYVLAQNATTNTVQITSVGLTTGKALLVDSSSSAAGVRELVQFNQSGAAPDATVLRLNSNGTGGDVLDVTSNSITTGSLARFYSNSDSTSTRNLVEIINDSALAVNTECLYIQQDANDPAMFIQHNANASCLDISTSATSAIAALDIFADSLTSGSVARFSSNSADATARNIVQIINDNLNATGAIPLRVQQDAAQAAIVVGHNANGQAFFANHGGVTTSQAMFLQADNLTTGKIAWFYSNSADTSARNLVEIQNDNVLATSATCLRVQQDADAVGVSIVQNVVDAASAGLVVTGRQSILTNSVTSDAFGIGADSVTTGRAINVVASGLTTGKIARLYSNSADVSTRNLVEITNDNVAATGATCLNIQQDAAQAAMFIDQNADGFALNIDAENTTFTALNVQCDSLTTGRVARFASDSADATGRNLVAIVNDNSAATGAVCLFINQDANQTAVSVDGEGVTTDTVLELIGLGNLTTGRGINGFTNSSAGSGYVVANFECGAAATGTSLRVIHSNGGLALDLGGANARARFDSSIEYTPVTVAASTYSVVGDDRTILVGHTPTAPVTVTIPSAQRFNGRELVIKDSGGNAGNNNITIATGGAETIDGATNHIINVNYASVTLVTDGTNWFIV